MTRGDQGVFLSTDDVEGHLPASAREVADVTGAGDTVIATAALALAAGATLAEAARLANEAAGLAVARFGPATITAADLLRAVQSSASV
jgi:D-beta-D-heptose 7-phosphate kinase/D-beta-D-heptose 1-phosphate adenosyltransferase